jgi:hypothetical protein
LINPEVTHEVTHEALKEMVLKEVKEEVKTDVIMEERIIDRHSMSVVASLDQPLPEMDRSISLDSAHHGSPKKGLLRSPAPLDGIYEHQSLVVTGSQSKLTTKPPLAPSQASGKRTSIDDLRAVLQAEPPQVKAKGKRKGFFGWK